MNLRDARAALERELREHGHRVKFVNDHGYPPALVVGVLCPFDKAAIELSYGSKFRQYDIAVCLLGGMLPRHPTTYGGGDTYHKNRRDDHEGVVSGGMLPPVPHREPAAV